MKICKKCGAQYDDDKTFCIDCNEKLGDKLSKSEEQKMHTNLNHQIEDMCNKRDPLYVSKFDKALGAAALVGAVFSAVLAAINLITRQNNGYIWLAVVFFLLSAVVSLIPRIMWELEKLRLGFYINGADDAEPSDYYLKCRKIGSISAAVFGIAALIINFTK